MPSLSSLVEEFLDARSAEGLSRNTIRHYRASLAHLVTFTGEGTEPAEISHRNIRAFLAHRRDQGAAPSSLASNHAALSAFWSWLVNEEEVSVNVVKKVARPRAKVTVVPLVTEDQMHALLKLDCRTPFLTIRNRAVLMILWDCGVRVGELCSITLEDVDFNQMVLRVNGKTGERDVPFGKSTGVALRRYLRRRVSHPGADSPKLFIGARGPINEAAVFQFLRKYGKRIGVPEIHPHMFRHTWVDNMLSAGATLMDVQVLGGWSSVKQILERYGIAGKRARAFKAHRRLSPGDRL